MPKVEADDEIHYLNPREQRDLRNILWTTVARSFTAGAISGFFTAASEVWLVPLLGIPSQPVTSIESLQFWGVILGVTGVATAFEIYFLYWDALRSVHRMSQAAGVDLLNHDSLDSQKMAGGLVRAALELPNSGEDIFGIDPKRGLSRTWVVLAAVAYKAKISVTNFLTKMIIRRLMGRAAVRSWLAFVAVPITGVWNMVVTYRVLQEARLRVMGPSAAEAYVRWIVGSLDGIDARSGRACLRAVACSVVGNRSLHPNLDALLVQFQRQILRRTGEDLLAHPAPPQDGDLDDAEAFLNALDQLTVEQQQAALRALTIAVIIDGRIAMEELRILRKGHSICGFRFNISIVRALRRSFSRGEELDTISLSQIANTRL